MHKRLGMMACTQEAEAEGHKFKANLGYKEEQCLKNNNNNNKNQPIQPGEVAHTCNSNTGEVELEGIEVQHQPWQKANKTPSQSVSWVWCVVILATQQTRSRRTEV
jgi:hypothetical protein